MGLLGPSFQIGRSALAAYQAAIAITGQNIANVGNPDYTRQSGRLSAERGGPVLGGVAPGGGVRVTALQRHIDEAVEAQLRLSIANRAGSELQHRTLSQVESLYNELSEQDLSSQLSEFFGGFSAIQATPTDLSMRNIALANAEAVVATFQRQRAGLLRQISNLNESATAATRRISEIGDEIARLNEQIVTEEARAQTVSGPLRDRRDGLLRELAQYVDVQVRPQDNGSVNVYLGSEPLVEFNRSRDLTTQLEQRDGIEIAIVRFADNNAGVAVRSGELAAIVNARDVSLKNQLDRLDQLARGVIYETNRVHSIGRGLAGYSQVTGSNAVLDPAAVLNSPAAGLPYPVENGSIIVNVRDTDSGQVISRRIEIDLDGLNGNDTTLADLAAALDQVSGLNASVTTDNRLRLTAADGQEFWFSEDTGGVLAALGVGNFFDGVDAGTIAVNGSVRSDPRLIAASASGAEGDGEIAGKLALVGERASTLLGGVSILDYHQTTISGLAVETASALNANESAGAVYDSLLAQREAVSGVSLDEEAIRLTQFERAYQGAARYLTVLDNLANEMLTLVR